MSLLVHHITMGMKRSPFILWHNICLYLLPYIMHLSSELSEGEEESKRVVVVFSRQSSFSIKTNISNGFLGKSWNMQGKDCVYTGREKMCTFVTLPVLYVCLAIMCLSKLCQQNFFLVERLALNKTRREKRDERLFLWIEGKVQTNLMPAWVYYELKMVLKWHGSI